MFEKKGLVALSLVLVLLLAVACGCSSEIEEITIYFNVNYLRAS
ncbi:hypothetical protein [Natroniella acetigena]|nr:hypothetical protein [Natroniella acetigena]